MVLNDMASNLVQQVTRHFRPKLLQYQNSSGQEISANLSRHLGPRSLVPKLLTDIGTNAKRSGTGKLAFLPPLAYVVHQQWGIPAHSVNNAYSVVISALAEMSRLHYSSASLQETFQH